VSTIIEGQTPDKVYYRAQHGPYDPKNVGHVLQKKADDETLKKLGESADLFFDIDLYETNFSFAEHSLFRWAETKVTKAIEFISISSGELKKRQGEK
jgi:hypothetical protein